MKRRTIAVFILTGLAASVASATDYYASSIHPNRSDSNSGASANAPWATFDKVKSKWSSLNAGDTVHLERGSVWDLSFSGDWYISTGGTAQGGPVTLRGDDYGSGAKPILKRTGGSGTCAFISIQKSYVTIRDIELDGGNSTYGKNTLGIAFGGDGEDASNINILSMKIHNLGGSSSAYVCGIWAASPTQNLISNCLIEGNEVSDYSAHGLNHYNAGGMINITWRNNIVRNSYAGGRYPGANSALQITSGSSGCLFEHNYLEDTTSTEGILFGFGKYRADTGTNTIRFNVIANSAAYGLIFTMDQTEYKLFYDIYGNIVYNNGRAGIAIHPYNTYAAGTRFNIYNNTLFNNNLGGEQYSGEPSGEVLIDNACTNTTINLKNNLIYHNTHSNTVAFSIQGPFVGTLTHSNNLYFHSGGAANSVVYDQETSYARGGVVTFEATAQNTDPLFTDTNSLPTNVTSTAGVSPDGLKPQQGSSAINNGTEGLGSMDIDGTVFPAGEPRDIGAYEVYSDPYITGMIIGANLTTITVRGSVGWQPYPEYRTNLLSGNWVLMATNEFTSTYPVLSNEQYVLTWTNLSYDNAYYRTVASNEATAEGMSE